MIQSVKLSLTVCLSFVVFYPPITSGETTEECSFGINCTCVFDEDGSLDKVTCNIKDTLPVFSDSDEIIPEMIPDLELSGNFHTLPSNFFEQLENIHTLTLIQTPSTPPVKANWSDLVFDKLYLEWLEVRNLDGLLPPPEALKAVGRNGLKGLIIVTHGGESVSLDSNIFADFKYLEGMRIEGVPISKIDQAAFADLEDKLDALALSSASLAKFPTDALKSLVNLKALQLTDNGLGQFPFQELTNLTKLDSLILSGNKIQEALDARELTNLPITLGHLEMWRGGLTKVPVELLSNLLDLTKLCLSDNKITSLKEGDFSNLVDLEYLFLDGNPITSIDIGTLKHMAKLEYLEMSRTRLTSFDLTLFDESSEVDLYLDEIPDLKALGGSKDSVSGRDWIRAAVLCMERVDRD